MKPTLPGNIAWQTIQPTDNIHGSPKDSTPILIPLHQWERSKVKAAIKGTAVDVIFKTYSRGVVTCRDAWTYNFNKNILTENVSRMIETYNAEVARWTQLDKS